MEKETKIAITSIKVDGGVSNSNILMQCLANYSGKTIYRSAESDLGSVGAAYFSGLALGIWDNKEEILEMQIPSEIYRPLMPQEHSLKVRKHWKKHIGSLAKLHKS